MPWGNYAIEEDGTLEVLVGDLGLHVRRSDRDFGIDYRLEGESDGHPERWALERPAEAVSVTPCVPDRPILVVTRGTFWVPPGGETTLYVLMPLWARVAISQPIALTLRELPTEHMDNVWLGSKVRGHLGYWHASAPELVPPVPKHVHFGVAPVDIHNESSTSLEIESIEVDCPRLPLYRTDRGLWLGSTSIRFNARGSIATDVHGRLPPVVDELELISGPGSVGNDTLSARAISRLRALSPL